MLSPGRDDDDDDSHLCIKCKATIVGLDNYIKHRRKTCSKRSMPMGEIKTDMATIDPLEATYSLGADVFFQSLELQSSVKKPTNAELTQPGSSTKTSSTIQQKTDSTVVSSSSSIVPSISALETNLRAVDWIGGHSLQSLDSQDNQSRLIDAVNNISGVVKKNTPSTPYNNPYNEDDDSEEPSENSDEDDEEEMHAPGGKWKPPLNHTGGKWRPVTPEQDEWKIREEHTGGKWKPVTPSDTQERDEDYDAPPPGHTKGKWVPGANEQKTQIMQNTIQSKGSVQYWCGACNRRLGSKTIYEKHLQSNLHIKKVLPESDLEFSGHLGQSKDIKIKRATKPSQYLDETVYSQLKRKRRIKAEPLKVNENKRKRQPYFIHCSGCKSKVRPHFMGKHLISHYHFRKTTNTDSNIYQQLVLDNIEAIVHQSPFQCSPCKFYTNWLSNLMQHWFTEEHENRMDAIEGRFWCSFCKYECNKSEEMLQHMSSPNHSDVVAVVNRSMPIIIRKKTILQCSTCSQEFRYNIEMKKHSENTGHELSHTATDKYQGLHSCSLCESKFKSSVTLASHLKTKHKMKNFVCLVCSKTFESSEEAKRHRYTSEHRIKQKEKLKEHGVPTKDLRKKCPYCVEKVVLKNILELKDHIQACHPNNKKKCPKCGMAFVLPQEVTRHIRSNACTFQEIYSADGLTSGLLWKCTQCLFQTDSQAECFFHEVLHTKPDLIPKASDSKLVAKYPCPICSKAFRKHSLRLHIRQHTLERPFVCTVCTANFTRQSSLVSHLKLEHNVDSSSSTKVAKEAEVGGGEKEEESLDNRASASNKSDVRFESPAPTVNPSTSREEEHACPHPGCHYVTTSASKLARHRRAHGKIMKRHQCTRCDFKTDQASHMKRHMICHSGIKPYGCPYCDFTCASLENLRKHAMRRAHANLPLYRCPEAECAEGMGGATAGWLRAHLLSAHGSRYTPREAAHVARTHLLRQPSDLTSL